MQQQKKMMDDALIKTEELVEQKHLTEATSVLAKAIYINTKYPPYIKMLKKLEKAKKEEKYQKQFLKKAKKLQKDRKLAEAASILKEGIEKFPANQKMKKLLQAIQKQQNDALNKMNKGQVAWKNGLLHEAVLRLAKAVAIDPSNKKIVEISEDMKMKTKRMDIALQKADKLIKSKKLDQAEKVLSDAGSISEKYMPYIKMLKRLHKAREASEESAGSIKQESGIQTDQEAGSGSDKETAPTRISGSDDMGKDASGQKTHTAIEGKTIKATFGPPPSPNVWKAYSITLTADNFGVDAQTFREVLSNVSSFRIRTEMHNGNDVGGIDTVRIGNRYSSDFSSGAEGWNAAGDGTMKWISSGGIPGGYLQIKDWASGEEHWAVAPVSWSGDWRNLIGSSIDFYCKTDHPSYSSVVEISSKQQNRLVLLAKSIMIPAGGSTSVSIEPYPTSSKDLVVSLKSSDTKCSTVPAEVTVPAGQANADIKVSAVEDAKNCNAVITASADGYGESRITLPVGEKAGSSKAAIITSGKSTSSTTYAPNTKGDVFQGGHWAGASGRSDWIQKDFPSPQLVTGIYIGKASTDITTDGFKLILKLKKPSGEWITVDELHNTNINRTKLSGGAIGKSIPPYTKDITPAIKATAFRLEFYGHGWFDATDIRIYTKSPSTKSSNSGKTSGMGSNITTYTGIGAKKEVGSSQKINDAKRKAALAKRIQAIKAAAKARAAAAAVKHPVSSSSHKEAIDSRDISQNDQYVQGFAGKWNSTYGVMELRVQGSHVTGHYTHDKGRIEAVLSRDGKTMKGQWAEAPSYKGPEDAGKMHFVLSKDGKKINGLWGYGTDVPKRSWLATRIDTGKALEKEHKKKSVKQFMGTLSGTWSGKGTGDWKGWTSHGTFTMNISENGKISGTYEGSDKGQLSGFISSSGELNMKSGGGSAGSGKWGGTIKIDSQGKLQGSGNWSVDGFKGTWLGKSQ